MEMKSKYFFVIAILVIGTAQLNAQAEFAADLGAGYRFGFAEKRSGFNVDLFLGVHLDSLDADILAGICSDFYSYDTGLKINYLFSNPFGITLQGGMQLFSINDDKGIVPYAGAGLYWQFLSDILKLSLDYRYHFNGKSSLGIMLTFPIYFPDLWATYPY
jgi:hypothetical protein